MILAVNNLNELDQYLHNPEKLPAVYTGLEPEFYHIRHVNKLETITSLWDLLLEFDEKNTDTIYNDYSVESNIPSNIQVYIGRDIVKNGEKVGETVYTDYGPVKWSYQGTDVFYNDKGYIYLVSYNEAPNHQIFKIINSDGQVKYQISNGHIMDYTTNEVYTVVDFVKEALDAINRGLQQTEIH